MPARRRAKSANMWPGKISTFLIEFGIRRHHGQQRSRVRIYLIFEDNVTQHEIDEQEGQDEGVNNGIHQAQQHKEKHCGQGPVVWQ